MPEINTPRRLVLPDQYILTVEPGKTVTVGRSVQIRLHYQKEDAAAYEPQIEILRYPGKLAESQKQVHSMECSAHDAVYHTHDLVEHGTYAFRVRPFWKVTGGELVEIHTITRQEDAHIRELLELSEE